MIRPVRMRRQLWRSRARVCQSTEQQGCRGPKPPRRLCAGALRRRQPATPLVGNGVGRKTGQARPGNLGFLASLKNDAEVAGHLNVELAGNPSRASEGLGDQTRLWFLRSIRGRFRLDKPHRRALGMTAKPLGSTPGRRSYSCDPLTDKKRSPISTGLLSSAVLGQIRQ